MRNYKIPFKWFYAETKAEAAKYSSITEFAKGSRGAYKSALKNNWLDEFFPERKCKKPYTFEEFVEKQKEVNVKVRFKEKYPSLYLRARENKWLEKVKWEKPTPKQFADRDDYVIYVYEDKDNKVVYVGLSFEVDKRHKRHASGQVKKGKRIYDVVYKYFNGDLPNYVVRMDNLNAMDATYYEDWYKRVYKNSGWTVLNIAPTGEGVSSIGGNGGKWTDFEAVRQESLKYKSKSEFSKGNPSAYAAALRYGWIDKLGFTEKKRAAYTKNDCIQIAKQFCSMAELRKHNKSVYNKIEKMGWKSEIF